MKELKECRSGTISESIVLCSGRWLGRTREQAHECEEGTIEAGKTRFVVQSKHRTDSFIVRSIQATRSIKQTERKWNANTGAHREWISHVSIWSSDWSPMLLSTRLFHNSVKRRRLREACPHWWLIKQQYNGGSYIMKSFKICILHLLGLLARIVMRSTMHAWEKW
jgi:hypothetical protein